MKGSPRGPKDESAPDPQASPFALWDRHPNFPVLADSLSVAFSQEVGRHVLARKEIRAGEVLVIEDPVSAHLSPYKAKENCSLCFRCIIIIIAIIIIIIATTTIIIVITVLPLQALGQPFAPEPAAAPSVSLLPPALPPPCARLAPPGGGPGRHHGHLLRGRRGLTAVRVHLARVQASSSHISILLGKNS